MRYTYSGKVRTIVALILVTVLARASGVPAGQEPAPPAPQAPAQTDQYFSGNVVAIDKTTITVTRTVLGTESTTKTFRITPETRFEGKPKVKSRVTVRFVGEDDGDRAVHILVRTTPRK